MNTDLFEIIHTTRSMRRLKPDPVPPGLTRQILEAGTAAPSGGNMQNWRWTERLRRREREDRNGSRPR